MLAISLVFFIPKKVYKTNISQFYQIFKRHLPYIIIILGVVFFQLLEVNLIDALTTKWVGVDFAPAIRSIEGNVVYWFSQHWIPALVYFFVFMYIAVYPFALWFSPVYFLLADEKKSMKTLAYGSLIIYAVALPFYLFVPVTNVYKFYGLGSALNNVIPSVENFFYSVTTQNNSFPSLHTAMTILVAWSVRLTGNKKFTYFAYFCMVSVILSVIYLAIHWITDVIFGALLATLVIFILNRLIKEK
jgi:membrane-associated phospholipid phosphatase